MEDRTSETRSSKAYDVLGFGALNWDILLRTGRERRGREVVAEPLGEFPGGSAANTVVGLALLGATTAFLGAVGDDAEGKMILESLTEAGVDVGAIRTKRGERTGKALCLVAPHGERTIYLLPGANSALCPEDVDLGLAARASHVLLSSFAGDEQYELQRDFVSRLPGDTRVHLSPGSLYSERGPDSLAPLLTRTDILFLNHDELARLTGRRQIPSGAEAALGLGPRRVVVTLGGDPEHAAYVADNAGGIWIRKVPAFQGPVVDTTGAGDAFAAGFLHGILRSRDLRTCGILGYLVSVRCVVEPGPRAGLPDLSVLEGLLDVYRQICET